MGFIDGYCLLVGRGCCAPVLGRGRGRLEGWGVGGEGRKGTKGEGKLGYITSKSCIHVPFLNTWGRGRRREIKGLRE